MPPPVEQARTPMKFLQYLLFPALLAGLVLLGLWVARQPRLHWPDMPQAAAQGEACPLLLRLQDLPEASDPVAATPGLDPPLRRWKVAATEGDGEAPEVAVSHAQVKDAAGATVPACILTVTRVPEPPFDGVDWRLGYRLDLPADLQGRVAAASFSAELSPDVAAQLGGGSVYLYDGSRPVDAGLARVAPGWSPVRVEIRLDPGATFVELWYRLAFQGGISNPVSLTFAAPTLTLTGAAAETR